MEWKVPFPSSVTSRSDDNSPTIAFRCASPLTPQTVSRTVGPSSTFGGRAGSPIPRQHHVLVFRRAERRAVHSRLDALQAPILQEPDTGFHVLDAIDQGFDPIDAHSHPRFVQAQFV